MHVNELPFINGGEPIEWAPEISTWMSLGVIIISMVVATIAAIEHYLKVEWEQGWAITTACGMPLFTVPPAKDLARRRSSNKSAGAKP